MNNFEKIYVDGVPTEKEIRIEYGCMSPMGFLVSGSNSDQSFEVTLHFAQKEPETAIAELNSSVPIELLKSINEKYTKVHTFNKECTDTIYNEVYIDLNKKEPEKPIAEPKKNSGRASKKGSKRSDKV